MGRYISIIGRLPPTIVYSYRCSVRTCSCGTTDATHHEKLLVIYRSLLLLMRVRVCECECEFVNTFANASPTFTACPNVPAIKKQLINHQSKYNKR